MRDTTNNIKDTESTNSNAEDLTNQSNEDTDTEASRNRRFKTSMRKKTKIQNNSDDELLKLLQDKTYDEDVSFCEMIIPMLKNLSTDQKHYAKIEILNVLNRATKYSPQNFIPPRVRSAMFQYQSSSSSYLSYIPNMPSPYPNTIRQSPSPQIYQYPPSFPQSPPDPSPQTQYTPSRNSTVIPQSPPDPSPQTQYTPSRNPTVIPQTPPDPSPQTQYTPSRNSTVIPQSPPDLSPQTQYTPSSNSTVIPQSPPDPSPQTQYTPSRNSTVIPQSPPDPSPQTQYTPSRNSTVIPQSPPGPSPQSQYSLSNFPNTSFNHSTFVVEGSGFDMKDYILFK
ncbi:unnamed protein product [Parnassius apollo]|uniref:(apollo) hypothetical protein n=1 Tax=Parnassius apollo TaxID=110799 RepID=A0A8S3XE31_PARAO|nr:unnamed protein product [Parnassius apollo]